MLSCTICNQTSEDLHPILNGGKLRDNYYKLRNLEEKTHFISSGYREHIHPQCLIFLKGATYIQERIQNPDNSITTNYIIFGIDEIHKNKVTKAKCATCSLYIPQKMPLKCSAPGCIKVFHADCLVKYKKKIFMTDQPRRREFIVYCSDHSKFLQQDYRLRLVDWQFWDQIVKETFDQKLEHIIENPRIKAQDDCIIIENEIYSDIDPKIVKLKEYLKQKSKKKTRNQSKGNVKQVQKQEQIKRQIVKKVTNGPQPFIQIDYSQKAKNNKAYECDSFIEIDKEQQEIEKEEKIEKIVKKCKGLLNNEELEILNKEKNKYEEKMQMQINKQQFEKKQINTNQQICEVQRKYKQEQGKEEIVTQQLGNNNCEQLFEYLESTRKKLNLQNKQEQLIQSDNNNREPEIKQSAVEKKQFKENKQIQGKSNQQTQGKSNKQIQGKSNEQKNQTLSKFKIQAKKLKSKQVEIVNKQNEPQQCDNNNHQNAICETENLRQHQNSLLSLCSDLDNNEQFEELWKQVEQQYFTYADIKQIVDGFTVDGQLFDIFKSQQNGLVVLYQGVNNNFYVQYNVAKEQVQFKNQADDIGSYIIQQEDGNLVIQINTNHIIIPNISIEHMCEIDQFEMELLQKCGKALHQDDPLFNIEEIYEIALEKLESQNQQKLSNIKMLMKNLPIPNVFIYTDKIKLMQIQKQLRRGFQRKSWESYDLSQSAKQMFNPQLKEPDPFDTFCMVCFHYYKSLDSIDEVLYCVDCWATFHQKCYQFGENQQKCDTCKFRKNEQTCQICFQDYENIPLKLIEGKLYHITCTIIFNFLYFENDEMKIKLSQLKFEAPCFICDSFKGYKIKCKSCDTYCHPLCAYIFGLNITYDDQILFICPKDDQDFSEQSYYEQVYFRQHGVNFRRCAEMKSFQEFVQNKLRIIETYKKVIKYSK